MCQSNYNTDRQKGEHLNLEEKYIIAHLYNKQDKNYTEIAQEIKCHRTTISREIKRGLVKLKNSDLTYREEYVPELSQKIYDVNGTSKGPKLKIGKHTELAKYIEEKIKGNYSPEVISQKIDRSNQFEINIHWKTIYNYIDKGVLLVDREDLVYGEYKKKKVRKKESRLTTKQKKDRTIRDRPKACDKRSENGLSRRQERQRRPLFACFKRESDQERGY